MEKLGMEAKLYRATGPHEAPGWEEIANAKDVTLNLDKSEADLTTRKNAGWRATVGALKEASVEFEMVWDTEDEGFTAIQEAWFDGTPIEVAVMDGPIDDPESQGLRATMAVMTFTRNEPLEEAITVNVTLKPTYAANPPEWINGAYA
ncbi:MAG TPA: phage tail tube protein [Phycisphaerae bacterium]|nr:phage tail tube protein [Phycisphaerae bacterium]HUW99910.1 phage tail tube protein [Phycisphaerae bacterium]